MRILPLVFLAVVAFAQGKPPKANESTAAPIVTLTIADIAQTDAQGRILFSCAVGIKNCKLAEGRTLDDVVDYMLHREEERDKVDQAFLKAEDACLAFVNKVVPPKKEKMK